MLRPEFSIWPYRADTDYDTAAAFWRGHGIEPWPRRAMSDKGIVVMDVDGNKAAIGHYYLTNANTAIIAPLVTNPSLPDRIQAAAVGVLIEALSDRAKADVPDGFLLALAHDAAVKNLFVKRAGFRDTGSIGTACLITSDEPFSLDIIEED